MTSSDCDSDSSSDSGKLPPVSAPKLIVAGSRTFDDQFGDDLSPKQEAELVGRAISAFPFVQEDVEVILSGANENSPDRWGESYASHVPDVELEEYPAEWSNIDHPDAVVREGRYGKYDATAGFRRNEEMAREADGLLAFWDGESSGTKDMIDRAREHGLPVQRARLDSTMIRRALVPGEGE
jgi:hypothetical protein